MALNRERGVRAAPSSRALERAFAGLCLAAVLLPIALLLALLGDVLYDGLSRLDWAFVTSSSARPLARAGVLAGLVGSLYLVGLTALIALPLGVGAALYLEEYGRGRLARIIELNISNLAGMPSILYGLLGLEVFARTLALGRSLIAGALMMALVVMPIVILSTREALRAVPPSLREAGLALGATRWQVIRQLVLPMSLPGIVTGASLAISRAIGAAAPLIVLGALTSVDVLPTGLRSAFTALPVQIFDWIGRPEAEFRRSAAAGIVLLLLMLLLINGLALYLRAFLHAFLRNALQGRARS